MAELEANGLIYQPHPSAGRVPTSSGYRLFVDQMMKKGRLNAEVKEKIRQAIFLSTGDFEAVFRESSRILAHLSQQLGILVSPQLDEGIFNRMDISRLGSEKILLVISIQSGIAKTIILEINSKVTDRQIGLLQQVLNERLYGLRVQEIREKFNEIVKDVNADESVLMHLFVESADRLFNFSETNTVFLTGTHHMLRQPEFSDYQKVSSLVESLEDKNIVIHLLDKTNMTTDVNIFIGEEIQEVSLKNCSIIAARYKIGQVQGTVGVIGPTRMDYSHLIPLVEFTASTLSDF
jgi:heat-inducible transcriptional repressor